MSSTKASPLRALPSIDQILRSEVAEELRNSIGAAYLTVIARRVTDDMRAEMRSLTSTEFTKENLLQEALRRLQTLSQNETSSGIRRVINATGVILHTNLGRAPLSDAARDAVAKEAAGYCTLEYDASSGSRGRRGARVEELLIQLTGAEAGLVVNNCASAALLVLTVLAGDGETIVSRGELVEIGGDFRVPDVMSNSGTRMIEVGSTNRTRLEDYQQAITNDTRLLMRVHPSNYRIVGFTNSPRLNELAALSHDAGLLLYEDAGSGAVRDLNNHGLDGEPIISESISSGADVVSFSGDKLLGASQAGLIVGRRQIVERLRKHSLYRALRADKLCLAALEATLEAHRRGATDEIPTLRMLGLTQNNIETRATALLGRLMENGRNGDLTASVVPGESAIGGGSGPTVHPATALIALKHVHLTADELERKLRFSSPPVVARIAEGLVLLDLRTVDPRDEDELFSALTTLT